MPGLGVVISYGGDRGCGPCGGGGATPLGEGGGGCWAAEDGEEGLHLVREVRGEERGLFFLGVDALKNL
jgi:hypothetical protein